MIKLSTRKIIGIAGSVCALTLLSLVVPNGVLRAYLQVAVLVAGIATSISLMGWAKPRHSSIKLVATLVILVAVVYQVVVFLLLGLKLGFVSNVYILDWTSIFKVMLPIVLAIIGEEILRGQLVERGKGSKLAVITTGVMIWLVEVMIILPLYNLGVAKDFFTLIVVVAGPAMLKNILLTYIAFQYDYRINIAYRLIMELPIYLMPVWPNAGEYLPAIFQIGLIFLLALGLASLHHGTNNKVVASSRATGRKPKRAETAGEQRTKRIIKWVGTSVAVVVVVGYVALMSGLFHYHLLAIGSGSMSPSLERGDFVLVEKSKEYDKMREGEVLVYRHSNVVMVHRIAEVKQDGKNKVFITKGDANGSEDKWIVKQADVIGVARGRIMMLGFPTLWLNELFNK